MSTLKHEFEELREHAIFLQSNINTFKNLFHSDEDISSLLMDSAGYFFYEYNTIMHQYIILSICRLVGPVTTGKKKNLSTQSITESLVAQDISRNLNVVIELDRELTDFGQAIEPQRHKLIAHLDKEVLLNRSLYPEGSGKEKFEKFLDNMHSYFNEVAPLVGSHPLDFRSNGKGDVIDLIEILRNAKKRRLYPWGKKF